MRPIWIVEYRAAKGGWYVLQDRVFAMRKMADADRKQFLHDNLTFQPTEVRVSRYERAR